MVDVAVLVGGGVERDLMPGGSGFRHEGQVLVVVSGGDHEEGGFDAGAVQCGQNVRRRLAGAVVKGQTDPFVRQRLRLGRRLYRRCGDRRDEAFVRQRGQVALPTAYDWLCAAEYPQPEPCRRPGREQQEAHQPTRCFAEFKKSHSEKPPC